MAIASVTYKTVIDLVKTYLTTNCNNVGDNYNNIPAHFKTGWTGDWVDFDGSLDHAYDAKYQAKVTANGLSTSATAASTVTTAIDNYVSSLGITQSAVIPVKNFPAFFDNMLSFCCRYIVFYTSQYSPSTVLMIYSDTGNNQTYSSSADEKIYAQQANDILTVLDIRLHLLAKKISVQYGYNFV